MASRVLQCVGSGPGSTWRWSGPSMRPPAPLGRRCEQPQRECAGRFPPDGPVGGKSALPDILETSACSCTSGGCATAAAGVRGRLQRLEPHRQHRPALRTASPPRGRTVRTSRAVSLAPRWARSTPDGKSPTNLAAGMVVHSRPLVCRTIKATLACVANSAASTRSPSFSRPWRRGEQAHSSVSHEQR